MALHSRSHLRVALVLVPILTFAAPVLAADVTVTLPAGDGFVIEDNTAAIERLEPSRVLRRLV